MMKTKIRMKYFHGETELKTVWTERKEKVRELFPEGKIKRVDSFSLFVGSPEERALISSGFLPVDRVVEYKENGTKHKCDARCQHAKGRKCECSCGGKYHGINS